MNYLVRAIVLSLPAVLLVPSQASAFTGGLLQADLTLTKANSPYNITQAIQIPEGVTLTVEPGVEIFSDSGSELFYVNGSVRILGSAENPVRISSKGSVFYPKNARTARIEVRHASVDGQGSGTIVAATGYGQNAHYIFADSDFTNMGSFSYIWYPLSFLAERNVFTASPGFSVGFDGRGSDSAPVFRNNLFVGAPKSTYGKQYWIEAWASYGSTLDVQQNTFSGGPYTAIRTTTTYDVTPLNARNNFWGTVDSAVISAMVLDKSDGLDYGTLIDTSGALSSPNGATPTAARYPVLSRPTPTPTPPTPTQSATPTPDQSDTPEAGSPKFNLLWKGNKLTVKVSSAPVGSVIQLKIGNKWYKSTKKAKNSSFTYTTTASPSTVMTIWLNGELKNIVATPGSVSTCQEIWKMFDGGLSPRSGQKNKGSKLKKTPTVHFVAATANAELDKDKDGLVCER